MQIPELHDPLFAAYFDLWTRHRALIALLARHTGLPAEQLETEATEIRRTRFWRREQLDEALEDFRDFAAALPPRRPPGGAAPGTPPPPSR